MAARAGWGPLPSSISWLEVHWQFFLRRAAMLWEKEPEGMSLIVREQLICECKTRLVYLQLKAEL